MYCPKLYRVWDPVLVIKFVFVFGTCAGDVDSLYVERTHLENGKAVVGVSPHNTITTVQ